MANKLQIQFRGLVGLLPMHINKKTTSMVGILPDVGHGIYIEPGPNTTEYIHPHVAALKIRADLYNKSRSSREPHFQYKHEGDDYLLFIFNRESMGPTNAEQTGLAYEHTPLNRHQPSTCFVSTGHEKGLQWIPNTDMAEIEEQREFGGFDFNKYLNEDLTPKSLPDSPSVAGTLVIETGKIYVETIRNNNFEFKVPGASAPEWCQSVFFDLIWELEINDDVAVFEFKDTDGKTTQVALNAVGENVSFEIVNLELETILEIGQGAHPNNQEIDFDMAVFYYLVRNVPSPQQGMPLPHVKPGDFPGTTGLCIPMMYGR